MAKAIESDIRISKVFHRHEHQVVINEVPVTDVHVHVSESTVVNGDVDPQVVVVNDNSVQGEI